LFGSVSYWNTDVVFLHDVDTALEATPTGNSMATTLYNGTGVDYIFVAGHLDTAGDEWDSFQITGDEVAPGRVARAQIDTMGKGSLLDAKVRFLAADGTELAAGTRSNSFSSLPDDPEIGTCDAGGNCTGFVLPDTIGDTFYVTIERENAAVGEGAYYLGFVSIED
jgi:hypothetical protein